ncbi:YacL family protein [Commensalibacter nepenthis]|uniref:YacL family protein n=1 Tax=Commensalibacter nepenthis TaxID=3043872 RepID=A0ABT6QA53_9PROT|nr:YacL family protein [Commensalibacter sp. TBRC 10068]MDI2113788.1 YacL family protein [Commensalibacter sp. TBRC 10068]
MITRKIYFLWGKYRYYPSGYSFGQNIADLPSQGFGACAIAHWLSSEIERSVDLVDNWISKLQDLNKSQKSNSFYNGEYWELHVKNQYVFICNDYLDEQKVIMTIEQFLYVLEQYKIFLKKNIRIPKILLPLWM